MARAIAKVDGDDALRSAKGPALSKRMNEMLDDADLGADKVEDLMKSSKDLVKWIEDTAHPPGVGTVDDQLARIGRTFSLATIKTGGNDGLRLTKAMFAEIHVMRKYLDAGRLKEIQPRAPGGDPKSFREALVTKPDGSEAWLEVKHWPNWGWSDKAVTSFNKQVKTHFDRLGLPDKLSIADINNLKGIDYVFKLPGDRFAKYQDEVVPDAIKAALYRKRPPGVSEADYVSAVDNYIDTKISVEAFTWD